MNPWFKAFLAGVGILSDAFNLFSINLVKNVMNVMYPQSKSITSAISTAALVGAVVGQLLFGALADRLGRRVIFISTITLVIVGSLGASSATENEYVGIYTQLCLWLAILGFGVGGEYPLSATVSSEGSADASRGKAVSSVFAMQGVGNLMASLVMFILLKTPLSLDAIWRLALGLGAAPGLLTVYWRYKMEESSHFVRAKTMTQTSLPIPDAAAAHHSDDDHVGEHSTLLRPGAPPITAAIVPVAPHSDAHIAPASSPSKYAGIGGGSNRRASDGGLESQGSEHLGAALLPAGAGPSHASAGPSAFHAPALTYKDSTPTNSASVPQGARWAWMAPLQRLGETMWQFRWTLLATAGSWLIFDVVFYANGLFSGTVLEEIGFAGSSSSSSSNSSSVARARSLSAEDEFAAAAAAYGDDRGVASASVGMFRVLADAVQSALLTNSGLRTPSSSQSTVAAPHVDGALLAATQSKSDLASLALGNLILACIGLPGYVVAVLTIDRIGRRNMQLMGFTMIGVVFIVMAAALAPLTNDAKWALVLLYGLSFFFSNFGPNTTTFVIPSEAFPTSAKATCHGISAASGKIGAAVGAAIMEPLLEYYGTDSAGKQKGVQLVLYVCGAVGVAGALWTLALTRESGSIKISELDAMSFRLHDEAKRQAVAAAAAAHNDEDAGGSGGRGGPAISLSSINVVPVQPPPAHATLLTTGDSDSSKSTDGMARAGVAIQGSITASPAMGGRRGPHVGQRSPTVTAGEAYADDAAL